MGSKIDPRSDALSRRGVAFLALLSFQFALQPILIKRLNPEVDKTSFVVAVELVKILLASALLLLEKASPPKWSARTSLQTAFIPALLYLIQNVLSIKGNAHVAPLTFNLLNQTKTGFAALHCWLVLGKTQTRLQSFALLILLSCGVLLVLDNSGDDARATRAPNDASAARDGVLPILVAAFCSGLSSALVERGIVLNPSRSPYVFSIELAVYGLVLMYASHVVGMNDTNVFDSLDEFFVGWTVETWIPVVLASSGGIVVGLVTKHAGSVRKGFALLFGIVLTAVVQHVFLSGDENELGLTHLIVSFLVLFGLYLHTYEERNIKKNKIE